MSSRPTTEAPGQRSVAPSPVTGSGRVPGRTTRVAGGAAAGIYLGFAGLQVALAAGAPLGEHVWGGGQEPVLSGGMRAVSGGASAVLVSMAWVAAARAGLLGHGRASRSWLRPATWAVAGYMALNTVGNAASSSPVERLVFTPATAAAAALTALVAASRR